MNETLHIYAQEIWHDEAYIAGEREALTILRDAIDDALKKGTSSAQFFTSDGEGFDVQIVVADEPTMNKMMVPYTDDIAKAQGADNFGPWTMLSKAMKK